MLRYRSWLSTVPPTTSAQNFLIVKKRRPLKRKTQSHRHSFFLMFTSSLHPKHPKPIQHPGRCLFQPGRSLQQRQGLRFLLALQKAQSLRQVQTLLQVAKLDQWLALNGRNGGARLAFRVHILGGGYFMEMKNSSRMGWNMVKLVQLKTWGGPSCSEEITTVFKRLKLRKNTEDASNSGYKSSKRRLNAAICWTDTR